MTLDDIVSQEEVYRLTGLTLAGVKFVEQRDLVENVNYKRMGRYTIYTKEAVEKMMALSQALRVE